MSIQADNSQNFESYVPVYDFIPEEWEEARQAIIEQLKKLANAVNTREIGWFLDEELLSGKQFYPGVNNVQQFRTILRTVIPFGALPNAGTKAVAHNVDVDENFSLISMWLSATDPVNLVGFSLAYYSIAPGDIKLSYTSTDAVVTTQSDYSLYTTSYIIFEYIKEL
jgi:hypothetical protein